MSSSGIDAGATGCKAVLFAGDGRVLSRAYREYDIERPQPVLKIATKNSSPATPACGLFWKASQNTLWALPAARSGRKIKLR
jgi:hypothetical protein